MLWFNVQSGQRLPGLGQGAVVRSKYRKGRKTKAKNEPVELKSKPVTEGNVRAEREKWQQGLKIPQTGIAGLGRAE